MGFFGKVFGGKQPKTVNVELAKAGAFLEKELAPKRVQLLDETGKRLAEIKHLLREASASLQGFGKAEAAARSNRLDKIVKTAKSNALRQLGSLLEKLSPPNTNDLAAIRAYCNESLLALQQAGQFGKNVAYAGISFKDEVKSFGASMKQLNKAFVGLRQLLNENKSVFMLDSLKEKLAEIKALQNSVSAAEKGIARLEKSVEESALQRSRVDSSLRRLREGDEFRQIDDLNESKASLLRDKQSAKTELLDLFAKIEKPLHRLDKAVKARKVFLPGKQAGFLHQLLQNPFRALKLDPKAETLRAVLVETRKAIESGVIELKPREKEKKLASLQELLSFDFFNEIFWKFNKIDSDIQGIERQLGERPVIKKEADLAASLKKALVLEKEAKQDLAAKAAEKEKAETRLKDLLQGLQESLSAATGDKVVIRA